MDIKIVYNKDGEPRIICTPDVVYPRRLIAYKTIIQPWEVRNKDKNDPIDRNDT